MYTFRLLYRFRLFSLEKKIVVQIQFREEIFVDNISFNKFNRV